MLPTIRQFMTLLRRFQLIERVIPMNNTLENDAEHSYQTAMVCWYIVAERRSDLNLAKVLRFALAHDLAEVFAGDEVAMNMDAAAMKRRQADEVAAAARLRDELPFPDLHDAITEYEDHASPEARLVYVVDKLLPLLNIELSGSDWYAQNNFDFDRYRARTLSRLEPLKYAEVDAGLTDEVMCFAAEHRELFQPKRASG
jgi:putative hydrolase of HD superfamily